MGLAKELDIMYHKRGYRTCDKKVCRDCIGNHSLKAYIKEYGEMSTCDYCNCRRKVVTIDTLMEPIMSGIHSEYDLAINCMEYDNGQYIGKTYDTYDLLHYELCDDLNLLNDKIYDDIINTMYDETWCHIDPYNDPQHVVEFHSWDCFCDLVKYHIRYVFYSAHTDSVSQPSNPLDILNKISMHIEELKLIRHISPGFKLYRGRTHNASTQLFNPSDFGPPPNTFARANRMSPEGISMFYAALDVDTALNEIYNAQDECATVACFKVARPLNLIDLSKIKNMRIPSIFDSKKRSTRSSVLFLKKFSEDISKQITSFPGIEYVPTQIVTEYLRHIFKSPTFYNVDGILYSSAQNATGHCVVLFMDEKDFKNDTICMIDKSSMQLKHYKKAFSATL